LWVTDEIEDVQVTYAMRKRKEVQLAALAALAAGGGRKRRQRRQPNPWCGELKTG
jgi:hypothetical protein